jgi:two-component system response regulator YesN
VFYIKSHLNEKITLQDLCEIALVSPQQLIRYFKKFTGKTPNEYVTDYKVNVAKDYIMRSNELSIKTIAYELGYDDQCYFSRVFSKITGESPTEYYLRIKNFNKHVNDR